jgi:energy-converting hydrogenase A subunit M
MLFSPFFLRGFDRVVDEVGTLCFLGDFRGILTYDIYEKVSYACTTVLYTIDVKEYKCH